MNHKLLIVFFAFALALPIIDAKRCNSCCVSCSPHTRRANNLQSELTKIKSSRLRLNIGMSFELSISTIDGKHIGYIQDVYEPGMTIPPNSQIYIISRIPKFSEFEFVRIFYDVNHKGLFNDLPIPGKSLKSPLWYTKDSLMIYLSQETTHRVKLASHTGQLVQFLFPVDIK